MSRHRIDLEEYYKEIKECEREVGSHDVPQPVPVGVWTGDTGHVEGVSQRVETRLTASTQSPISVQTIHTCGIGKTIVVYSQGMVDHIY